MRSRFLWGCLFGLVGCGGSTPPPDAGVPSGDAGCVPFDAGGLDPAVVTAGGKLIVQYRCQQCHGQSLSGNPDGVQVSGTHLLQYPPNLTGDPETGLGCWSNAEISRAVLDGVDNEGAAMCGPMPHLRSAGASVSDVDAMVAFLRSLPVYSIAVPEAPACACATNADCPPSSAAALTRPASATRSTAPSARVTPASPTVVASMAAPMVAMMAGCTTAVSTMRASTTPAPMMPGSSTQASLMPGLTTEGSSMEGPLPTRAPPTTPEVTRASPMMVGSTRAEGRLSHPWCVVKAMRRRSRKRPPKRSHAAPLQRVKVPRG